MGVQTGSPSITWQLVPGAHNKSAVAQASGTQSQTSGDGSNTLPSMHRASALQEQTPPQSAPPCSGSQSSLGSSPQLPRPGHGNAAMPPQKGAGAASATQTASPSRSSQRGRSGGQSTRSHRRVGGVQ